ALSDGRISDVVDAFDDRFTFNDQALELRFIDKERLNEFFRKGRELFPDTVLEILSTFECGHHVIAEWKVTASETMPLGSMQLRLPISFQGASIVSIENEKITSWSDYYDQNSSRRFRLLSSRSGLSTDRQGSLNSQTGNQRQLPRGAGKMMVISQRIKGSSW